jgi:hypothetical protein
MSTRYNTASRWGSGVGPTPTWSIIMSQNPGNGEATARKVAEAPHKKKKKKNNNNNNKTKETTQNFYPTFFNY